MNNVFATSSSVLSAETLERQSGRKVVLLETGIKKKIKIPELGAVSKRLLQCLPLLSPPITSSANTTHFARGRPLGVEPIFTLRAVNLVDLRMKGK